MACSKYQTILKFYAEIAYNLSLFAKQIQAFSSIATGMMPLLKYIILKTQKYDQLFMQHTNQLHVWN